MILGRITDGSIDDFFRQQKETCSQCVKADDRPVTGNDENPFQLAFSPFY